MDNPIELIRDFIIETKLAILILQMKKTEIENHLRNGNITRTIGTSVSVTGAGLLAGALVLAPFTGGTSIIALSAIGSLLGIGGAAARVATEDFSSLKTFTEKITKTFEDRNKIGEKLAQYFKDIETIFAELLDAMDEEEAAGKSTFLVLKRGINSTNFRRFHNLGSFSRRNSGINSSIRAGQFRRSMRLQSQGIRRILNNLGINVGRNTEVNSIRTGPVVLSTIFVYFDVKLLIDCWQNKHPNLAQIEELLESIRNQLNDLNGLSEWLNKIPDDDNDY